ncbi:hypothetical protein DRI50_12165 [candidate division KSB1 bacterium]|nr:MAG: hypothetical protein DRI50_12165 [candidate division KSB1 bacterium]
MNRKPELLFEKFEIETVIKKDAYSAVYLARHIYLGKRIFLKTLNTKELADPTLLHRFKREAKILAHLEHPHIIKVLDFGTFGDQFYISFEYFESENLRHWLKKRSLTEAQKEFLLAQLAQALHFAHSQGVVHRDLKPENILINEDLELKIADFGLALWNDERHVTEATSIVGTPAYMSPEQIRGEELAFKTDLFNLGLIVFELFKDKNPFLGTEVGQTLNNILNFDEAELRRSYEDLPQNIVKILDGLLRKNPQERFASAGDVLAFLPFDDRLPQAPFVSHKKSIVKAIVFIALPLFLLLAVLIVLKEREKRTVPATRGKPEAAPTQPLTTVKKDSVVTHRTSVPPVAPSSQAGSKKNGEERTKSGERVRKSTVANPVASPAKAGELWIECQPWARVTIDSVLTVTTPLKKSIALKAGRHRLVLRHPAYPEFRTTVQVKGGEKNLVKFKLDTLFGYLDCQVFPWGKIFVDGKLVDVSPLKKPVPLAPGRHVLVVENPQFPKYSAKIDIAQKDTTHVRVHFSRDVK